MRINHSYRQGLQDQLAALIQRSIAARRQLDAIAGGMRFGGDPLDTEQLRQKLHVELLYLDQQKSKLRHELGLRELPAAIKLAVPARKSSAVKLGAPTSRKLESVRRAVDGGGLLTRDLTRQ